MIRTCLNLLSKSLIRRFTVVPSAAMSSSSNGSCLFCKISDGKDDKTVLLRDVSTSTVWTRMSLIS